MNRLLRIPFSRIHSLVGSVRAVSVNASSHLDVDLYQDLAHFDAFPPVSPTSVREPSTDESTHRRLPRLLLPTEEPITRTDISLSFFLVEKEEGELLDELTFSLAKSFKSKTFYVASSGALDILSSGLALLCCGKSMDHIPYFDGLMHRYRGQMNLGQTSPSCDLKTAVDKRYPWRHITDEQLSKTAKGFVGDILLPPSPIVAYRSTKAGRAYGLRTRSDMTERPGIVRSFDVQRSLQSPDVAFDLVCDAALSPESLIGAFGRQLGCGALVSDLHKTNIGDYGLDLAWKSNAIRSAFAQADEGMLHRPDDPNTAWHNGRLHRHLLRVIGCSWHVTVSMKPTKLKPYEKRQRRRTRLMLEDAGLISEEKMMKRKLSKKKVKLVANLNVPDIEEVYERMLEE